MRFSILILFGALVIAGGSDVSAGIITSGVISGFHNTGDSTLPGGRIDYTASGQDERTLTSFGGAVSSTHTAIAATDGLKARLHSVGSGSFAVRVGVVDTYTITGGTVGESISASATLHLEGFAVEGSSFGIGRVIGNMGYGLDSNGNTTSGPVITGGSNHNNGKVFDGLFDLRTSTPFAFDVFADLTVESGTPFDLSSNVTLSHTANFTVNLLNTATLSFDLPDGYTITSEKGFGTSSSSTAVAEPSSMALLGIGALGLLGYGRRSRRNAETVKSRNPC